MLIKKVNYLLPYVASIYGPFLECSPPTVEARARFAAGTVIPKTSSLGWKWPLSSLFIVTYFGSGSRRAILYGSLPIWILKRAPSLFVMLGNCFSGPETDWPGLFSDDQWQRAGDQSQHVLEPGGHSHPRTQVSKFIFSNYVFLLFHMECETSLMFSV